LVRTFTGVCIGIVAISFASIFIRFCNDVPSLMIATYRLTLSSVILLIIAKCNGIRLSSYSKRHLIMGILGGVFYPFTFFLDQLFETNIGSKQCGSRCYKSHICRIILVSLLEGKAAC